MNKLEKFAEEIVDAVGEALGVDTGTINEHRFNTAKIAARIVLAKMLRGLNAS
jgi:hypothetical protein